jgi:hypothetical protein
VVSLDHRNADLIQATNTTAKSVCYYDKKPIPGAFIMINNVINTTLGAETPLANYQMEVGLCRASAGTPGETPLYLQEM